MDAVDAGQPVDEGLDVRDARGACQTIGPKRELHAIGAAHLLGRSHTHGSCHLVAVGRHGSKPGTGERRVPHALLLAVAVACLYEEGAVEHVHPTCEPELPRSRRRELDRRSTERGERLAHSEVWEDNPRGTITVLLTIEDEPERNTFLDTDQVRGVPALHRDLHLLDPCAHLSSSRLFRAEEEPRERRDQRHTARRHEDLRPSHVGLTLVDTSYRCGRCRSIHDGICYLIPIPWRGILRQQVAKLQEAAMATQARGYTATKKELLARLARIEGQVRGVARMVEEDRYCIDVVTQINAAGAALDKVGLGLLDGHVRHCLIGGHGGPSDPDEQAEELMGAVGRMVSR